MTHATIDADGGIVGVLVGRSAGCEWDDNVVGLAAELFAEVFCEGGEVHAWSKKQHEGQRGPRISFTASTPFDRGQDVSRAFISQSGYTLTVAAGSRKLETGEGLLGLSMQTPAREQGSPVHFWFWEL